MDWTHERTRGPDVGSKGKTGGREVAVKGKRWELRENGGRWGWRLVGKGKTAWREAGGKGR